jgi:hypothetical protein
MLKHRHVFDEQRFAFTGIKPSSDLVLIIRLYCKSDVTDDDGDDSFSLVAWTSLSLAVQGNWCREM